MPFQFGLNLIECFMRFMLARYLYDFPFLGEDNTITVDDNCVDPLYKHVFPPEESPQLSFIGLPWKVSVAKKMLINPSV
jgi:hypothetical protein